MDSEFVHGVVIQGSYNNVISPSVEANNLDTAGKMPDGSSYD